MARNYNVRSYGGSKGFGNKFMSGSNGHSPSRSISRTPSGKAAIRGSAKYGRGFKPARSVGLGGTTKVSSRPLTAADRRYSKVGPGRQSKYSRVSTGNIRIRRTDSGTRLARPNPRKVRIRRIVSNPSPRASTLRTSTYRGLSTRRAARPPRGGRSAGVGLAKGGGAILLVGAGAVGFKYASHHVSRRVSMRVKAHRAGRGSSQKRDSRGRFA